MGFSASRGGFSPFNFWPHWVKKSRGRRIKKKYIGIIAIGIISNLAYYNNISVENLRLVLIIINLN